MILYLYFKKSSAIIYLVYSMPKHYENEKAACKKLPKIIIFFFYKLMIVLQYHVHVVLGCQLFYSIFCMLKFISIEILSCKKLFRDVIKNLSIHSCIRNTKNMQIVCLMKFREFHSKIILNLAWQTVKN